MVPKGLEKKLVIKERIEAINTREVLRSAGTSRRPTVIQASLKDPKLKLVWKTHNNNNNNNAQEI